MRGFVRVPAPSSETAFENNPEHDLTYPLNGDEATGTACPLLTLPLPSRHRDGCGLRWRARNLCGLSQPGFKAGLAESCTVVWNQCSLAHLFSGVPSWSSASIPKRGTKCASLLLANALVQTCC